MSKSPIILLIACICVLLSATWVAAAPTVDGTLTDSDYGGIVATQTTQTGFGDNSDGTPDSANGSELNSLRLFSDHLNLYVGVAGNLETNGNLVAIWIDTDNNPATGASTVPTNSFMFAENTELPLGAELCIVPNVNAPNQTIYMNGHLFNSDGSSRWDAFLGSIAPSVGIAHSRNT
jgi:hypothetical protein